jgi:hypothetical protein
LFLFRFYTSVDLADKLLTEFDMTIVGTLTANRKGLPKVRYIIPGGEGGIIDINYFAFSLVSILYFLKNILTLRHIFIFVNIKFLKALYDQVEDKLFLPSQRLLFEFLYKADFRSKLLKM